MNAGGTVEWGAPPAQRRGATAGPVRYDGWGRQVAGPPAVPPWLAEPAPEPPSGDPRVRRPRVRAWQVAAAGPTDAVVATFGALTLVAFTGGVARAAATGWDGLVEVVLLFAFAGLAALVSLIAFLCRVFSSRRPIWLGTWLGAVPGFLLLCSVAYVVWQVTA